MHGVLARDNRNRIRIGIGIENRDEIGTGTGIGIGIGIGIGTGIGILIGQVSARLDQRLSRRRTGLGGVLGLGRGEGAWGGYECCISETWMGVICRWKYGWIDG